MPQINAAGLALVEEFEQCFLFTYDDGAGVYPPVPFAGGTPKGILTTGWGHTPAIAGETITQTQADTLLSADLRAAEQDVQALVQVQLTPNEFSALVSFEFNTGALATSPGLALINEGVDHYEEAWGSHFCLYVHDANGNTLAGLIRRRAAERALFFAE